MRGAFFYRETYRTLVPSTLTRKKKMSLRGSLVVEEFRRSFHQTATQHTPILRLYSDSRGQLVSVHTNRFSFLHTEPKKYIWYLVFCICGHKLITTTTTTLIIIVIIITLIAIIIPITLIIVIIIIINITSSASQLSTCKKKKSTAKTS